MTPHIFNEKFERVITLTSDATKDRIPYIKRLYKENNIKSEFYFSVDPEILTEHKFSQITDGGISCTWGHYGIISAAIIDEIESIVVLEDDVFLCNKNLQLLEEFFNKVEEWEILQLGYNYTKSLNWQYTPLFGSEDEGYEFANSIVSVPHLTYGSHCIGMNKAIFKHWGEALRNNVHKKDSMYGFPFVQYADSVLSSMYSDFKSYMPTKNIIGALSKHKNDEKYYSDHDIEFNSIVS